jgi:Domain of unknown function (DUF4160)
MPTVLRLGPYRFFFFANDAGEPPHVHVERDACVAKFWLAPPRLQNNRGFSRKEGRAIRRILEDNQEMLMMKWEEFFDA